ncbi:hypothetical protein P4S63_09910 [Pseudoalteromonas sp. B193]
MPDAFIILPLHKSRFITRGFNQVSQVWQPCLANYAPLSNVLIRDKKHKLSRSYPKQSV